MNNLRRQFWETSSLVSNTKSEAAFSLFFRRRDHWSERFDSDVVDLIFDFCDIMIWNWNWCWFEAAGGYRATILTFCISLRPKLGECSTIIGSFWKIGADISLALESCLLRMCSFRAFCVMYDLQHFWHLFPLSTAQFRLCLSKLYDDEKFWLQPPHTWVLLVRFSFHWRIANHTITK